MISRLLGTWALYLLLFIRTKIVFVSFEMLESGSSLFLFFSLLYFSFFFVCVGWFKYYLERLTLQAEQWLATATKFVFLLLKVSGSFLGGKCLAGLFSFSALWTR